MTPSNPDDARYTLTELADLAGVTPRTVRYYLAQGLLPTVGVSGPGTKYDDRHLARLRVIRRLQREHQPLAEIRRQLEPLDDDAIVAMAEAPASPPPTDSALDYIRRITASPALSTPPAITAPRAMASMPPEPAGPQPRALLRRYDTSFDAPSAPAVPAHDAKPQPMPGIERSQWERVSLGPDVELHIRRPLPRAMAKRVDRLMEIARDLLQEDTP